MSFKRVSQILCCVGLCCILAGCVPPPKGFLRPSEGFMAERQLESRKYDTKDTVQITAAVVGVLQDMGFEIDESETELGFVAASSQADATNPAQIAAALALDITAALFGACTNSTSQCDKEQKVKIAVIARPTANGNATIVRATFQRIVWNMNNQISRVETVEDAEVYQKFFEGLSKSIFLEAHSI
jgi:hypothetical protein